MTPLRFSMLTAALLAFAANVHGQAPAEPTCPCSGLAGWLTPYLQQLMQTWQRVRTLATGHTCDNGVCGSVVVGSPGCCKLGSCATGAAGCVKCGQTAPAPDSCCGAKACACCEICKAKKDGAPEPKWSLRTTFGFEQGGPRDFSSIPLSVPGTGQQAIAPPRFGNAACPALSYAPAMPIFMPPRETHTGSLMLGAGVNSDNGVVGHIVINERNIDPLALQQAEHILKMAEFYARTGHPGAAQFYHDLLMRRNGPMMPAMAVPYQAVQAMPMPMSMPPMWHGGFQQPPCMGPLAIALPFEYPHAPPMPVPPPPPMAHQVVQVHALAAQPMYMPPPPPVVHVAECAAAAPAIKHAHLVTPDLEAHCARMTHRGDTIILEGDVILLNKKHAQPIRIEAQRAVINMKDGTITVDGPGAMSIKKTQPLSEAVRPVAFPLRNVPAARVAAAINNFYQTRCAPEECCMNVRITFDDHTNTVIAQAPPADLKQIRGLIESIDTPDNGKSSFGVMRTSAVAPVKDESRVPENRFRAVRLRHSQANDVARTLSVQIANGELGNDVVAQAEPISNSIILSAPAKSFELLVKMVADLDRAPSDTPQTIVLMLQKIDASEAAMKLQRLLLGADRKLCGDAHAKFDDVRITVDERTNAIIVHAAPKTCVAVTEIVDNLDRAPQAPPVEERRVQVIRLRNAQACHVVEAINQLQQLLKIANNEDPSPGSNSVALQRDAAVAAEPVSNSVLISATPRCFEVLVRIIGELDGATKAAAPPVIAPVR